MEIYQIPTLWWSDGRVIVGLLETGCWTNANPTQPGPGTFYMYICEKMIARVFAIVLMKINQIPTSLWSDWDGVVGLLPGPVCGPRPDPTDCFYVLLPYTYL
jgi:hypothetical protein